MMKNLNCLKGDIDPKNLDRKPFSFSHSLADHPALSIESLIKMIPEMPKEKVMFSKGLDSLKINFDNALDTHTKQLDLMEVIETIRTSNAYIAVRNSELHESFKVLYKDLIEDIAELLKINGTGTAPIGPTLWLFIASPNAVTPFHFDRTSNFIMQIRGSKELAIFPPRSEEVFSRAITESYMDWEPELPLWTEEVDKHAHKFHFKTGDAAHIPFTSGHYVKNGSEDISITLSIFFHSDETLRWSEAMKINNRLRKLGISSQAVDRSLAVDSFKSTVFPAVDSVFNVARKLRGN
ncbi:MAG: cupin-like domain-containing protein [Bacteriovorax sp.]|nr:cupin-like domain-containing protein [Bacteriovorax sp.]